MHQNGGAILRRRGVRAAVAALEEEQFIQVEEQVSKPKLRIIPLGGLEQIGMNITAYEYRTASLSWIAVWRSRRMIC